MVFAQSQPIIPPHRLERDISTGICTISLLPEEKTADDAPILTVRGGGNSKSDSLGVTAVMRAPVTQMQLVAQNARNLFPTIPMARAPTVVRTRLWRDLAAFARDKAPFYVTARLADGSYASSRYDSVDPLGIVRLLEQDCGFASDQLSAKTDSQRLAEEQALNIRGDDLRHIRWVLVRRYAPGSTEPGETSELTSLDRGFLERYTTEIGQPKSRFLTRIVADRLLHEPVEPRIPEITGTMTNATWHGDWLTYVDASDGWCVIQTAALSWQGDEFFMLPLLVMQADPGKSGSNLSFDMVRPNPFVRTAPVWATIDGRQYDMQQRDGEWIMPRQLEDGLSDEILIGMRRSSSSFQISSTSKRTSGPLSLTFSPIGFSAAFSMMMKNCNRYGLKSWIE